MIFTLKIQSVSDIITNSSSEVFQFQTNLDFEVVKEIIEAEGAKNAGISDDYSGDGGTLDVRNWEDAYKLWMEWEIPEDKRKDCTPEIWALHYPESLEELKSTIWISIDWARKGTIDFILDTFWVTCSDTGWQYEQIDPETDEVVRLVSKATYDKLPENCKG